MAISPYASKVVLPDITDSSLPSLVDFLDKRFPKVGRNVWETRIREGKVLDGAGTPVTLESPYLPQTCLHYFREVPDEPKVPFEEEILFQNSHLLVACKPHFLPVIPSGPYVNECLLNRLKQKTGITDLTPINRIDRETAGLVLFSTRKETRGAYQSLFMEGRVTKTYEAVTEWPKDLKPGSWLIENRIVKGEPWFRMKTEEGKVNAVTEARVLEVRGERAHFSLSPLTGKKHQLRLHLSGMGCRIINDRYYPTLLPEKTTDFKDPLQLLARGVAFTDPVTGEKMEFFSQRKLDG